MKKLLIVFFVFGTISAFAQSNKAEISVDWERIERGLASGDFSCVGTCAKISIDWAEAWHTVNGKNYRDKKKDQASNCERFYTSHYERLNNLRTLALTEEITNDFYQDRLNDESDIMNVTESTTCNGVSTNQRKNLKLIALRKVFNVE